MSGQLNLGLGMEPDRDQFLIHTSLVFMLMSFYRTLEGLVYVGGQFFGAAGYADDIILLAPCRSAMAMMIQICEDVGVKNNLKFSTDDNPAKSKTKCIYMLRSRVRNS